MTQNRAIPGKDCSRCLLLFWSVIVCTSCSINGVFNGATVGDYVEIPEINCRYSDTEHQQQTVELFDALKTGDLKRANSILAKEEDLLAIPQGLLAVLFYMKSGDINSATVLFDSLWLRVDTLAIWIYAGEIPTQISQNDTLKQVDVPHQIMRSDRVIIERMRDYFNGKASDFSLINVLKERPLPLAYDPDYPTLMGICLALIEEDLGDPTLFDWNMPNPMTRASYAEERRFAQELIKVLIKNGVILAILSRDPGKLAYWSKQLSRGSPFRMAKENALRLELVAKYLLGQRIKVPRNDSRANSLFALKLVQQ